MRFGNIYTQSPHFQVCNPKRIGQKKKEKRKKRCRKQQLMPSVKLPTDPSKCNAVEGRIRRY
jgi:hypothetical protein